ncbi:MAG: c-type cytochrome [Immundisolibacteraceae bacterium]|nr:c-type cytochrome [Immundisolibacteraceae bacterium]
MLKRLCSVPLLLGALVVSNAANADDLESSLAAAGCVACHRVDVRLIGPSYKEVADKYRGDETAAALLLTKVREGGSGNWGPIPMAPHGHLSEEQIKPLIAGILAIN